MTNDSPETTRTEADDRADFVRGLREVADFLEVHPEVCPIAGIYFCAYMRDRSALAAAARTLGRAEKGTASGYFHVERHFGPHRFAVYTDQENVCERVVVGTEKVRVTDPDAPLVEREVEKVEWRCAPSLLAEADRG